MNSYSVKYSAPSNIAIVKYWGKKGRQLPLNPSLSFTLDKSKTITKMVYSEADKLKIDFLFEGKSNEKFKEKLEKKLLSLTDFFPWLNQASLKIESENTFPHSTGIASSASSMAAIALCLVDIDQKINGPKSKEESDQLISKIARLLSGSASRSIYPVAGLWGQTELNAKSSDDFAIGVEEFIHPKFKTLHDAILIVDSGEKSVSSTAGHELMNSHPHRESRIKHANQNTEKLFSALKNGDFKLFTEVSEVEALDLHSMMFTSNPSFILLRPNSLKIIEEIRLFRSQSPCEITFTIDAGPNIHVLYTDQDKELVEKFLKDTFLKTAIVSNIIFDQVGNGAVKYNEPS